MTFTAVVDQLFSTKKNARFFRDKANMDRGGIGVGLRVRVKVSVYSSVLGIFLNIPAHYVGTTRGSHQIPRFLYFIAAKRIHRCGTGVSLKHIHIIITVYTIFRYIPRAQYSPRYCEGKTIPLGYW